MSRKKYYFKTQENIGKYGEAILDKWLSLSYQIQDVSAIKKYQQVGIDRILTRPDGTTVNVEYKFDLTSAKTGNIFFETVSVDKQNIPGWGWRSQADYWIFLLPTGEVLVVEPAKLRHLVWQYRLEAEEKEIKNVGYNTVGVPIPLPKVRSIASYITKLELDFNFI